jgi:hypothetical protein
MPRTGTISVIRAMRAALGHQRVLHIHYMHPETIARNLAIFQQIHAKTAVSRLDREFLGAEMLHRYRAKPGHHRLKLISLVRDPMARTVSAFFKQFELDYPGMSRDYLVDPVNLPRLSEMFFHPDEPEAQVSTGWFDKEVRDVFGIDVFAKPFPHDPGYLLLKGDDCDLLLLRLESFDQAGPAGLAALLPDLRPNAIPHANSTRDRDRYYASYKKFVETLRPPTAYLDRMYLSRLARHFYTPDEIALFRSRWES